MNGWMGEWMNTRLYCIITDTGLNRLHTTNKKGERYINLNIQETERGDMYKSTEKTKRKIKAQNLSYSTFASFYLI